MASSIFEHLSNFQLIVQGYGCLTEANVGPCPVYGLMPQFSSVKQAVCVSSCHNSAPTPVCFDSALKRLYNTVPVLYVPIKHSVRQRLERFELLSSDSAPYFCRGTLGQPAGRALLVTLAVTKPGKDLKNVLHAWVASSRSLRLP